MKYSERIKAIREDTDKTQAEIASVIGTTYQYYSTYESGKRELPFSRAIKLAKFYNISLDYIAAITDIQKPLFEKKQDKSDLTDKQKKLLKAYSENPRLQAAIDKLLDLGE